MDPSWALRMEDEAPLSLVAMLRGSAWFVPDRRLLDALPARLVLRADEWADAADRAARRRDAARRGGPRRRPRPASRRRGARTLHPHSGRRARLVSRPERPGGKPRTAP